MKNIFCTLEFIIIAISVYACGYKGPLYLPKNTEASTPVTSNNESHPIINIKVNESATKNAKLNESSIKQSNNINPRSNLNESN